jgi:hypothetical protein
VRLSACGALERDATVRFAPGARALRAAWSGSWNDLCCASLADVKPDEVEAVAELEAVARVVIADVHRTTPLRLAFSPAPWFDDDAEGGSESVYGVIHFADRPPAEDALAPNGTSTDMTQAVFDWGPFLDYNFDLTLAWVAGLAASVVQGGLWSLGLDPTWPACPEHSGRHPVRPAAAPLTDDPLTDPRTVPPMLVTWRCYQPIVRGDEHQAAYGPTAIPVGNLAMRNGVATFAAE